MAITYKLICTDGILEYPEHILKYSIPIANMINSGIINFENEDNRIIDMGLGLLDMKTAKVIFDTYSEVHNELQEIVDPEPLNDDDTPEQQKKYNKTINENKRKRIEIIFQNENFKNKMENLYNDSPVNEKGLYNCETPWTRVAVIAFHEYGIDTPIMCAAVCRWLAKTKINPASEGHRKKADLDPKLFEAMKCNRPLITEEQYAKVREENPWLTYKPTWEEAEIWYKEKFGDNLPPDMD